MKQEGGAGRGVEGPVWGRASRLRVGGVLLFSAGILLARLAGLNRLDQMLAPEQPLIAALERLRKNRWPSDCGSSKSTVP